MGMTIDLAIEELESTKDYPASDPASDEALDFAIEIMRKYQTMQEVLDKVWNVPSCMLDEAECLSKIMETYRTVRW
jgi:hypothetical protein